VNIHSAEFRSPHSQASSSPSLLKAVPPPPRVVVESVSPEIDGGKFPIKRTVGEFVDVCAHVFADGHDELLVVLRFVAGDGDWQEVAMLSARNDEWHARFTIERLVAYRYTVVGWVDHFATWRRDLKRKSEAAVDVAEHFASGCELIKSRRQHASPDDRDAINTALRRLQSDESIDRRLSAALDDGFCALMQRCDPRDGMASYTRELVVQVDPRLAVCGAWYEMFPRSAAGKPGLHGTFDDCIRRLPYVAGMEFDILYLPPIHPIGTTHRKGKNNAVECGPGEPGSPWAIGSDEGGHKAIHPALGTIAEFRKLVTAAQQHGLAIALDIAFQCSPDHPYVKEHPDWFQHRSDGSIRYAENPPKEYQDIYPFDFESKDWRALWAELKSVFEYWIGQGVTLFRVDNPHTKPFAFWEWLMAELHRDYPEVILLAEAFTRPKIMDHLARIGFSQSYTYFTWRNSKRELTEYMTELTKTEVAEYFRPNLWPNTPDILHAYLQQGGRPAFAARLVLAATLAANYGIYGPAYELADNKPLTPGSEEYLNSEKYEIRQWDIERSDSLRELIKRVNMSRRANPALQSNRGLVFHDIENDRLLCYSKATDDKDNVVLIIVNLDPFNAQSGWTALNLNALGLSPGQTYVAHDLLTGTQHVWKDERNFVEISPRRQPAHLFVIDCKGAS